MVVETVRILRAGDHTRRPTRREPLGSESTWLLTAIALSMVGVFALDQVSPLGFAVWILYFIPVAFSFFLWRPAAPLWIAAATSVLIGLGYLVSPPTANLPWTLAVVNRSLGLVTLWSLAAAGNTFIRNKIAVRRQEWLQSARTGLSEAMGGDQTVESLAAGVLRFLAEYLEIEAGAFYARRGERFELAATYGVPTGSTRESFGPCDGLLAQSAEDRRIFLLQNIPDGYLTAGSGLGRGRPLALLIAPILNDGRTNAVIELGAFRSLDEATVELMERVSESIGVAVRSAEYRSELRALLDETRRQAVELEAQGEELRVSNEELEEQGRALRESQARLELQQSELEQTNTQLEEQTQVLESQRDDLGRAKSALEEQARALERASRYKSDFLANMSHELRTPLNSSLILARLLADNPQGNLDDEQVEYARTILSAGNDLLNLINDVLDLSKIEAGRMEVRPEPLRLSDLVADLSRAFEPVARQKGLTFQANVAPGCPEVIETDRQRLEQVLKNLLSNALKFTELGGVTLDLGAGPRGGVAFAVTDTGIGIPEHQQSTIFEAFCQADGTTNRKYGGTGLGLSISRDLVRLLGGELRLSSEPGHGSTFTVLLPARYAADPTRPAEAPGPREPRPEPLAAPTFVDARAPKYDGRSGATPPAPTAEPPRALKDDRDQAGGDGRVLLIVEDDESFARILCDLAHELGFRCLVAATAEDAMTMAAKHLPSALLLDVGLPDHSGLSVLDRLKHDARTRHIPVHVVSGSDHTETALALGAVGYMLKPVRRDQLAEALKGLEQRLERRMRRVLVVEDDEVQLRSLQRLLGSEAVETVGSTTAAECLERLRNETFDCMVLDLTLPDATGYSLLETLSTEDAYSFPPVIIYTGRVLSDDDEQRLRRYSKSIIIKGAKSPERLLDEVTLFLHQVVTELPPEQQRMLARARSRDAALEGRRILVVEDDVRNVFALTSVLEPRGAIVQIARNGREALEALDRASAHPDAAIDLVLMDVMMPEMDGLTATREIRRRPEWNKLPVIILTAKAMKDDQERCLEAGANDYMAKPLDVEKLLSLVRVWMPR